MAPCPGSPHGIPVCESNAEAARSAREMEPTAQGFFAAVDAAGLPEGTGGGPQGPALSWGSSPDSTAAGTPERQTGTTAATASAVGELGVCDSCTAFIYSA